MFANINRALGSTTPQQRAQMLAIAGGSSPSPTMGNALYGQSQAIMQALADEERNKAQLAAQLEEQKFRAGEGALDRQSEEARTMYRVNATTEAGPKMGSVYTPPSTPESVAAFNADYEQTGKYNYGLLVPHVNPVINYSPWTGLNQIQPGTQGAGPTITPMGGTGADGQPTTYDPPTIADNMAEAARKKALATKAAEQSSVLAKQVDVSKSYISKLYRARELVSMPNGAWTGQIDQFMPTFRDASTELKNISGLLGLDLIAMQTFGQLSNAEREFAVNTALPTDLKEPAMVEWINRKISAQEKMLKYYEAASMYLAQEGATEAGMIKYFRDQGRAQLPASAVARGLSQEEWDAFATEDKDKWIEADARRPNPELQRLMNLE